MSWVFFNCFNNFPSDVIFYFFIEVQASKYIEAYLILFVDSCFYLVKISSEGRGMDLNSVKNGEWFSRHSKDIGEVGNKSNSGYMGSTMLKMLEIEDYS